LFTSSNYVYSYYSLISISLSKISLPLPLEVPGSLSGNGIIRFYYPLPVLYFSLSNSLLSYFWIILVSIKSPSPAFISFFVKSITTPWYCFYTTISGSFDFFTFFFNKLFIAGWLVFVGVFGITIIGFS
jgi:hypothetical protein